jgi:hypothetical protein
MATRQSPYEIPYEQGSTPAAIIFDERQGGQTFPVIHDQRVPYFQDQLYAYGGTYDAKQKIARFPATPEGNAKASDFAAIVADFPYYELPRSYAKYVAAELSEQREAAFQNKEPKPYPGVEVLYRTAFDDNPYGRGGNPRIMCASKQIYDSAMANLVEVLKQIQPEQFAALTEAVSSGKLTDELLERHELTVDQLKSGLSEGTFDRNDAQRYLNLVAKAGKPQIDRINEYVDDGKLTSKDFEKVGASINATKELSVQQVYDLQDLGKKRAPQRLRDQVSVLVELGYSDGKIRRGFDPLSVTERQADQFIEAKLDLLTPEQKDHFDDVVQNGYKPKRQAASAVSTGKLEEELAALAPGKPISAFNGNAATTLRIVTSGEHGLAGFTDENETSIATLPATQIARAFNGKMPLRGDLVVVAKAGQSFYAFPTKQNDRDAALVEHMASSVAERMGITGLTPAAPNEVPTQGEGTLLYVDKAKHFAALATDDKKLATVPDSAIPKEAKLTQKVAFNLNGAEGAGGAEPTKAKPKTPARSGRG